MAKTFVEGIKTPFKSMVKMFEVTDKNGAKKKFSYLHWALALALADRPSQEIVTSDGAVSIEVFGGCVVGVSQALPNGGMQTTWLPVLNGANQPVPEGKVTSRDLGDTLNRCRAKAAAMVNGVGLSLYAHGLDDTVVFINSLGVKPTDDLSTATPRISSSPEKNGDFIDWAYSLAAARLTDPNFRWEVLFYEVMDSSTGEVGKKPYFRMGKGWGVAVQVWYRDATRSVDRVHTEVLPIMGFREVDTRNGLKKLDHQPLENPNAHDWNRSVMRCLVKAIAYASGYGLSVYAKAEVDQLHVDPLQRKAANDEQTPAGEAPAAKSPPAVDDPALKADLIKQVSAILKSDGKSPSDLLKWLSYPDATDLSVATVAELQRGLRGLRPPEAPSQQPAKAARAAAPARPPVAKAAGGEAFL